MFVGNLKRNYSVLCVFKFKINRKKSTKQLTNLNSIFKRFTFGVHSIDYQLCQGVISRTYS